LKFINASKIIPGKVRCLAATCNNGSETSSRGEWNSKRFQVRESRQVKDFPK
jgi:hypothetical protein